MSATTTSESAMPISAHLNELRKRIVRSALAVLASALIVWNFYPYFFEIIRRPFDVVQGDHPNAILALPGVTSGFSMQLRVTLAVAVLISSPIWLYQVWRFIAPGLHSHERKWAYVFTAVAVPLFASGVALAYAVMPQMLNVLFSFTPDDVSNVTSVENYISFFLQIVVFFGVGFLLPLVLVMLNFAGILTGARIKQSWRWIILGSFMFGAIATPNGDPVGMTVIAVPMILLTCVAMFIALLNDKRRAKRNAESGTNQWSDDEISPIDV